ncbi:MAG: adenylosuccinate lyase [Candidatus Obscuribacter sp.]|nr:adenylosuccinate lyase [Candidatus Obscuribacter sp.]MBK7837147.1 adenylosuccinate lyase [Candidatus Obscuribacter sp.]MBK9772878.1 adenylosuccinate lyase [Candidatus Obscuribacter sp.]MBL0187851.1 adenylosuccinate lyase [Candidatus Obscuribacter sp.]MBP6348737.1 adenylosuccinate lyase [Candidatus Obscuribacter sp.]
MIDRYTRAEMGAIWSLENKFQTFLDVELAVMEAQCAMGLVPPQALAEVRAKARFDVKRIDEIEAEVRHDVIAFLTNISENVGESARFVHMGLTSSDVIDTALALQLKKASELLMVDLEKLTEAVLKQARKHKRTIMVGRSHGIHAEPITFGFKLAVWLEELRRHKIRLEQAIEMISVGQMSGPVGTFSNISPEVETRALKILNLTPAPITTQVIQRDRHAQFVTTLALIAASLEKFSIELRHLQRTDVLEAEEPFHAGQKGSSAMPHKRNPVSTENISGLARVIRGNAMAAMENVALWHERDISHSSVERIILPDSTILLDYMLNRFTQVMEGLNAYPDNMRANMDVFGGVIFSQSVLLKLIDKGLTREAAYKLVQENAMKAWNVKGGDFRGNLIADKNVREHLSESEISGCFDPEAYLKNIDQIFDRVGV